MSGNRVLLTYYSSNLADKIHEGREGVQYLDYKVLTDILKDTEPGLFNIINVGKT